MSDNVVLSDEKYNTLIDGYVRQLSNAFKLNIPSELIKIINIFYPKLDKWSKILSDERLSIDISNGYMINRIHPSGNQWFNGYGIGKITPSDHISNALNTTKRDLYIIKTWRIKIITIKPGKWLMLGVIASTSIDAVSDYFCCSGLGYGLSAATQETFHYYHNYQTEYPWKRLNISFKKDSIVDVILYFKKGIINNCCLGYRIKNDNHTIIEAFDDLPVDKIYHIAASFWDMHCLRFVG